MGLFNRFRTVIALVVLISFFGFVNLSARPANEMSSGAIEKIGGHATVKKSPLVPILIGVVAVGAVAAILILVVFKTKYDPRGTWNFKWRDTPSGEWTTHVMSFSGDRTSGTATYVTAGVTGPYTLDGKKLNFQIFFSAEDYLVLVGEFQDKDTVTGTYTDPSASWIDGQFELTRQTSAASLKPKPTGKLAGESGR